MAEQEVLVWKQVFNFCQLTPEKQISKKGQENTNRQ